MEHNLKLRPRNEVLSQGRVRWVFYSSMFFYLTLISPRQFKPLVFFYDF